MYITLSASREQPGKKGDKCEQGSQEVCDGAFQDLFLCQSRLGQEVWNTLVGSAIWHHRGLRVYHSLRHFLGHEVGRVSVPISALVGGRSSGSSGLAGISSICGNKGCSIGTLSAVSNSFDFCVLCSDGGAASFARNPHDRSSAIEAGEVDNILSDAFDGPASRRYVEEGSLLPITAEEELIDLLGPCSRSACR